MTHPKAGRRRLVLVGGGHSHAQVLERWIHDPLPDVDLWVVSPDAQSPYSGMVPGWLAGLYAYDAICIDVAALCADAGATFVHDEMVGLDATRRQVQLRSGAPLPYDVLSLDVGSTLDPPSLADATVLPLRPLSQLRCRWDALLAGLATDPLAAVEITVVGGGAAGFECVVALHARLRQRSNVRATLCTTGETLLPGLAPGAVRHAARVLAARGIALHTGRAFDASNLTKNARHVVVWAAGARPHAWQRTTGLAIDADGYFLVDRYLRSTSHPEVYASGDCAGWTSRPLPKAGVYAVRMGPVLTDNLRAALDQGRPRIHHPQRDHLVLLSTAHRQAIASKRSWSVAGSWVWRWKDWLDRRFIARFQSNRGQRVRIERSTEES